MKSKNIAKGEIICPRCKSANVDKDFDASLAIGVPQQWRCKDCGYSNFIFPEITKLNKKSKSKKE